MRLTYWYRRIDLTLEGESTISMLFWTGLSIILTMFCWKVKSPCGNAMVWKPPRWMSIWT